MANPREYPSMPSSDGNIKDAVNALRDAISVDVDAVATGLTENDHTFVRFNRFDKALLLTPSTPATMGANKDDYDVGTAGVIRLSASAGYQISGMAGGYDGMFRILVNVGGQPFDLLHNNGGSAEGNCFWLKGGADMGLQPNDSITLVYDLASLYWREVSRSSSIAPPLGGYLSSNLNGDGDYTLTGIPDPGGDTDVIPLGYADDRYVQKGTGTVADATDTSDVVAQLNALLAELRARGILGS